MAWLLVVQCFQRLSPFPSPINPSVFSMEEMWIHHQSRTGCDTALACLPLGEHQVP